jgi:hypothetical protein
MARWSDLHSCRARVPAHIASAIVLGCIAFMFLFGDSAGATSSDDLSAKVLAQVPIPGLAPTTPGPTNGPIGPSNISFFGGKDGIFAQQIASGGIIGYIRAFTHVPPNGQAVVIEGDWVKDKRNIPQVLAGIEGGAKGPRFNVPGVVDAIGFETTSATTTEIQYVVAFSRGNYVFLTLAESADGSIGKSSAVSVAKAQAATIPGAPTAPGAGSGTSNAYYRAGEILGVAVLALAIVAGVVIAIRKSGGGKTTVANSVPAPGPWPVTNASAHLGAGWHQTGQNFNEQFYWDGHAWTGSRQWRPGVGWTESPLTQSTDG